MKFLFGHPTGNPNSHQAALAHFEAGRLEAFCVPWMPSVTALKLIAAIPGLGVQAARLGRRHFEPLVRAPKIQGRLGEMSRLLARSRGNGNEGLSYEANDWLMRTMARECRRSSVTAVHAYEDCSLWQFEKAKSLGKHCIYDMPIGYYPAWEQTQAELAKKYADWLPAGGLPSSRYVRREQKRREMELADLVLVPSMFVKETILRFHSNKKVALAPYGVDLNFWTPPIQKSEIGSKNSEIHFIYAGQISIRKGIPVLLEAWQQAGLKKATLELIGLWQLNETKKRELPPGVTVTGALPREQLRDRLRSADIFLFPSFFEGRALVVGEAVACGLPVLASDASGWDDAIDGQAGRVYPAGDEGVLVESLRWFSKNRDSLPAMKSAARAKAEQCTWANYRRCVNEAVMEY